VVVEQLRRRLATRLVGQVRELRAGLLLDEDGEYGLPSSRCLHLKRRVGGLRRDTNSFTDLYGIVVSQSTNWSSAMTETGVSSRQLNGIWRERQHVDQRIGDEPCSGRLRWTSCRKRLGAGRPPLSDTTMGWFISLFFWMAACIMRAI
jgi:hypothetical protein